MHDSVVENKERQLILCAGYNGRVQPHFYDDSLMEKAFNAFGMFGCPRHLFTTVHIL